MSPQQNSVAATINRVLLCLLACALTPIGSFANVSHGTAEGATNYYHLLSKELGFSTPENIFETKLEDVANYLGYAGITGADLQNLPSEVLMDPNKLLTSCAPPDNCTNTLQHRDDVVAALGGLPIRADDILVSRFFAPKIMNIKESEATRKLGWRKLVRIHSRPGSAAFAHHISSGIILFNIFTEQNSTPFGPSDESVNTQVMLITELSSVPAPNKKGPATLYWLDYDKLSSGGRLSLALHASFDANELPPASDGSQDYFVPDGCVACHGANSRRSMVNYLDTDHWFDRLGNDFPALKTQGLPLLFDAKTNAASALSFQFAFDVIRRFNDEADAQARKAQPKHDEVLAAQRWLDIHAKNNEHVLIIDRAIGPNPRWSVQNTNDTVVLDALNQYCFRCHGSVKFSVFNKQSVHDRRVILKQRIDRDAALGMKMPPDRELPDDVRTLLLNLIK